jgi:hypothetical protein
MGQASSKRNLYRLEVERSTYYAHVNRQQQDQETIHRSGRPAPGISYTQDGKPISDEQICEWIMELHHAAHETNTILIFIRV